MLTDADRRLIEAAVTDVETRTRGEIFCVVAQESSDYREVPLAWAAIAALGGPAILLMAGVHVTIPDLFGGQEWTAAQIGAAAEQAARAALAGAIVLQGIIFLAVTLLVAVPGVRRAMTPRSLKRERVRRRALEQFMAKNL